MSIGLRIFHKPCLSLLIRRMYTSSKFSQTTLEHLKSKVRGTEEMLTMAKLKGILNERLGGTTWLDRHRRMEAITSTHNLSHSRTRTTAQLAPRMMIDSFSTALIPLSEDMSVQDRYVTFLGHVRLGRLMEDLDLFAVWVAADHLAPRTENGGYLPGNIVTLLVDSIDFTPEVLKGDRDIRVSGFVSWCGHSTIETELWMEQEESDSHWKIITHSRFLMALRDQSTNKAAPVNRLVASDAFESELLERANERRRVKRAEEKSSLYNVGPHPSETNLLHRLIYENMIDKDNLPFQTDEDVAPALLVERARLSSTVYSHPEDRNMYNSVFGGYLMRMAVELSWACGWLHFRQKPQLIQIGDIRFHRPVAVASLLRMRAFIIYTEGHQAVIKVIAFVHDPMTGDTFRTNDFHLTYRLPEPAPEVLPRSYESALMYLEGRRRLRGLHHQILDGHSPPSLSSKL